LNIRYFKMKHIATSLPVPVAISGAEDGICECVPILFTIHSSPNNLRSPTEIIVKIINIGAKMNLYESHVAVAQIPTVS
jgi:hypothetical protein